MRHPIPSAALLTCLLQAAFTPAYGQSSLGLTTAEVGVTADSGDSALAGFVMGDYRITGAHGFQLDVRLSDRPQGVVGQIDGHLYLAPADDRKYGFTLSLADADGREMTIVSAGIEGIFQTGDNTFLSGRAVLGYARPGDIDFIGLSGGVTHVLTDRTSLFAEAGIAEIDEALLNALPWTARIGITYQPEASPFELSAALAADGIGGRDSHDAETRLELGLTWRFGGAGGARRPVSERAFGASQPFDPLLRRELF